MGVNVLLAVSAATGKSSENTTSSSRPWVVHVEGVPWNKAGSPLRHAESHMFIFAEWRPRDMEIFKSIAYGTGIAIAISLFIFFLVSSVPHLIDEWDGNDLDREEALAFLQSEPSYLAMYERFPDAVERFTYSEHNDGEMEVGVRNPDTGMNLILRTYVRGDVVSHTTVTCADGAGTQEEYVRGLFAEKFIKTTDCLDRVN